MEGADVFDAKADRVDDLGVDHLIGFVEFRRGHFQRLGGQGGGLVEVAPEPHQSGVAFGFHGVDDRLHLIEEERQVRLGAAGEGGAFGGVEIGEFLDGDVGHDRSFQ